MRKRLEARCEGRVEASNRQQTNHSGHHEKARVGSLAERETVGQLRLALRELRFEEEELQPVRKKLLPLGWKRYRVEEIKGLAVERNISTSGPDGKPLVKEALIRDLLRRCERQTETGTGPLGACAADVLITTTTGSAQSS